MREVGCFLSEIPQGRQIKVDLGATYDHVAVGTRFHVISSPFFARNETRIGIRQTLTIKVLKDWLVNC